MNHKLEYIGKLWRLIMRQTVIVLCVTGLLFFLLPYDSHLQQMRLSEFAGKGLLLILQLGLIVGGLFELMTFLHRRYMRINISTK